MTVNINRTPNRLFVSGDTTVGHHFGALKGVSAKPLHHHPHIEAQFLYGVRLELTPTDAVDLARELVENAMKLGAIPDCSGAVWDWGKDG